VARLTDPEVERCYRNALANWQYNGFVVYEKDAADWIRANLDGVSFREFSRLLNEYVVCHGGEIDQVVERRFNWINKWSHHYDLRPTIQGVRLYVETRLHYRDFNDPDDPVIFVVHVKPA